MSRWSRWTVVLRRRLAVLTSLLLAGAVLVAPSADGSSAAGAASAVPFATVIAHRGDRTSAPENTLAAFRSALFKGADGVEFDVWWTRDGVPVVLHDDNLSRTSDCSGYVSEWTSEALAGCDAGSWFSPQFRGERVPTLASALGEVALWSRSAIALVHLKGFAEATQPARILDVVAVAGMLDRTVFIADEGPILQQMKAAGAERLGLVFSWPGGWDWPFPYMIPQDVALDGPYVTAAQHRGVTVWAIEGHPAGLLGIGRLAPVDGVLVNDLDAVREDQPGRGSPGQVEFAAPGWSVASDATLSIGLPDDPDAVPAPAVPALPVDVPWPSHTLLSFGQAPRPAPAYVEPSLDEAQPAYGPYVSTRDGGWRPSGRLRGPAAGPGI